MRLRYGLGTEAYSGLKKRSGSLFPYSSKR